MKRLLKIFSLFTVLFIPYVVNAAYVGCSSSGSVSVGNTINVSFTSSPYSDDVYWQGNINYDSTRLRLVSGEVKLWVEGKSSANYTFKAIASGSAYVKVSDLNMAVGDSTVIDNGSSSTCSINVSNTSSGSSSSSSSSQNSNKSSNNKLSSLSIEGVTLSPKFSKDTLSYSGSVENSVTSITISATKDDSEASMSGTGEKELIEGTNKFNIVVTAANGSSRTYSVLITREEADPIKVKVGKKEYTVQTKLPEDYEIPEGFKESTTNIDGKEVVALKNESETLTLVLLSEEGKEPKLFVYDENALTYIPFNLLQNNSTLVALDTIKKLKGFKTKTIEINDNKIKCLVSETNKDFILVYALNIDTGNKDYYIYNKDSNSFIKYDKKVYSPYMKKSIDKKIGLLTALKKTNNGMILFASLASASALFFIAAFVSFMKNRKLKKRLLAGNIDTVEEKIVKEENEEHNTLTEIDQEELNKHIENMQIEEPTKEETLSSISNKDLVDQIETDELQKIVDGDIDEGFTFLMEPDKKRKKKKKKRNKEDL